MIFVYDDDVDAKKRFFDPISKTKRLNMSLYLYKT